MVRDGLNRLAALIGPNSLVQKALPSILKDISKEWRSDLLHKLEEMATRPIK